MFHNDIVIFKKEVLHANFYSAAEGVHYAVSPAEEHYTRLDPSKQREAFLRIQYLATHSVSKCRAGKPYLYHDFEIKCKLEIEAAWEDGGVVVVVHPLEPSVRVLTPVRFVEEG